MYHAFHYAIKQVGQQCLSGEGVWKSIYTAIVSKGMCLQQNYNPNPIMQIKPTAIANQF